MAALPELHLVVEAILPTGAPPWPWPVADHLEFVRLSGRTAGPEVGAVMAQVVAYNRLEAPPTVAGMLSAVAEAESLILPGGVRASGDGREVNPGCCCGLEEWRGWLEAPQTGDSPWMGHDPSPWVEWAGEVVRVWSTGGIGSAEGAFAVEFERGRFEAELARLGRDLRGFLSVVADWARKVSFSDPAAVCRKLDACFRITSAMVAG